MKRLPMLILASAASALYADEEPTGKLVIFHAGSLAAPFKRIAAAFREENPKVEIVLEAAGSRTCARKIADLERPCDVMASADYTVIDRLLIPRHASWNIKFATNEMAIVYDRDSRRADEIDTRNWHRILMDRKVIFGRSDPNADPCGYRTVLTMKLAEKHYRQPGLAKRMLAKNRNYMRPKETDLLALLESDTIDYIFLYRSVAQQHGLRYVVLPDEVNLKQADLTDRYATVSVEISGKKPGEKITKTGAPMMYGVTIPRRAPNPGAALAFVRFLLTENRGMAIMEELGQPSAVPSVSATYEQIPLELRKFAKRAD